MTFKIKKQSLVDWSIENNGKTIGWITKIREYSIMGKIYEVSFHELIDVKYFYKFAEVRKFVKDME